MKAKQGIRVPSRRKIDPRDIPHAVLASDVVEVCLDNGLVVLAKEVYPASVVCLSLWVRVGSVNEPEDLAGISHFIEHMLFKGTETRAPGEIAQEVHSLGGYLNAYTSYDTTCFWIVAPSKFLETALEIQADAIANPLFDQAEVEKEASVIIEELKMYEDRPDLLCFQRMMRLAYEIHRYGRPIIGYEQVIRQMDAEKIKDFYRNFYRPNNMVLTIVGALPPADSIWLAACHLGDLVPAEVISEASPPEPEQREFRHSALTGEIAEAHLDIAFHIPNLLSPDTPACDILSQILGEGRSSRLHENLREKKGLVTSIGAMIFAAHEPGVFIVDALLAKECLSQAESAIFEEIEKIKVEGVTPYEMEKAKNMVESSYIYAQETVEGQAKKLGYYQMFGHYKLMDEYLQRLYSVTAEDVERVARRYLSKSNSTVVSYAPER